MRKSLMTVEAVRGLLKDGYGVEDIQKYYGYKTKTTVLKFMVENKINIKIYNGVQMRQPTSADDGKIYALYTSGKFSLRETAAEIRTSKKLLYEYLQRHPKLIPVRERRNGIG